VCGQDDGRQELMMIDILNTRKYWLVGWWVGVVQ
jgi:ribosome modulation factor